jgi:NhaA family Na+:H+ antiporter
LIGAAVWAAVLFSGIHSTLAGVAVAAFIPLRGQGSETEHSPLHRLEHALHPFVVFGILPIFALANAGLSFEGLTLGALLAPVPLGIACGLFIGKQVGVMAAAWLAVKAGWAVWPEGATPVQIYGVALLCGIGFTMSLFIGGLAFTSEVMNNQVKLGVFCGSLIAAIVGYVVLRFAKPAR